MIHGGNMTYDRKVMVELDWDTVDKIVQNELRGVYESLKYDLERRAEGKSWGIFATDEAEDIAQITEHIYALELILKYYGAWSESQ
jgi:hypothetical protein